MPSFKPPDGTLGSTIVPSGSATNLGPGTTGFATDANGVGCGNCSSSPSEVTALVVCDEERPENRRKLGVIRDENEDDVDGAEWPTGAEWLRSGFSAPSERLTLSTAVPLIFDLGTVEGPAAGVTGSGVEALLVGASRRSGAELVDGVSRFMAWDLKLREKLSPRRGE